MNAQTIVQPIRKLRKAFRGRWRAPTPEKVHKLRTNIRRYVATVESLQCEATKSERRCARALDPIRRRAGKVRDLDVLTSKARALAVPDDPDCVVLLLEKLGADRLRHIRKLKRLIARERRSARRRLKRTAAHVERHLANDADEEDRRRTVAAILATALTCAAELAAPVRLTRQTLHPYRLKIKALRDALRSAAHDDGAGLLDELSEAKDAIGEWHDWERLIEIAAHDVDAHHGSTCALARELRRIAQQRFTTAIAVTTRMRHHLTKQLSERSLVPVLTNGN
jgi:CHAD domain-containing protein